MTAPPGWTIRKLADVCLAIGKIDPIETGRPTVRYVDISSVTGQRIQGPPTVNSAEAPGRCRQVIKAGDTLFSTVRPYLMKIALVGEDLSGEFASTGFSVLRVDRQVVDHRYLHYFALSSHLLGQVLPMQRGVSYPAVTDRQVRQTSIWFPCLEQQRRIVDILEDHLSRLDAASQLLVRCERRLTAALDATVTTALLGGTRPSALTDIAREELPGLPERWTWSQLGAVADVAGGVTKDSAKQSDPTFVEVPYLRVANVQRGRLDLTAVTRIRVSPAKADQLRLLSGDVLLNEGGDRDKLARGWVWEGQIDDCIHQNHVFRARVREASINPYLLSWIGNTLGAGWAERNATQSVNLASISLTRIRRMPVPVPPVDEQRAILERIESAAEDTRVLQCAMGVAARRASALRRALLTAAFAGCLTDRADSFKAADQATVELGQPA